MTFYCVLVKCESAIVVFTMSPIKGIIGLYVGLLNVCKPINLEQLRKGYYQTSKYTHLPRLES